MSLNTIDFRKLIVLGLVLLGAVLLPAYLIKLSNEHVFPSTLQMANGMLVITVIAALACMIVASHKGADDRLLIVAITGEILLGIMLWVNMGGHWQLAREVDAARQAVEEANDERDRLNTLAEEQAKRDLAASAARAQEAAQLTKLASAQAALTARATERCRLTHDCRPVAAPSIALPTAEASSAPATPTAAAVKPSTTPDEVRSAWMESLTWRAYVETGLAILILVLLGTLWHVDWDGDGLADRIQRLAPDVMRRLYPEAYARYYPQGHTAPVASPAPVMSAPVVVGAGASSAPGRTIGFAPSAAMGAAPTGGNRPLAGTPAPTLPVGAAPTSAAPTPRASAAPTTIEIIGYRMPVIEDVEWEGKSSKGVIVAGWIPAKQPGDRRAPRLGQFGKRRLEELFGLAEPERRRQIEAQVAAWRDEKARANAI